MLNIKELNETNFPDFVLLLRQRGEAPEDYYRWKYLTQVITNFPTGFIAYYDNEAVGCIGNINRTYVNEKGNEYPATIFADWYVTKSARGKGVGVSLMKKVFSLSPFGFGIPGPANAQVVAKKAGYIPEAGYYEVSIPYSPFEYGYRLYNDNRLTRFLRGCKYFWISPGIPEYKNIQVDEIKNDYPSGFEFRKNALKRETAYLNWLQSLPSKTTNPRKWYKIITEKGWLIIYAEKEYRNIVRARVIDFKTIEDTDDSTISLFLGIQPVLAKMGILFLQAYVHLRSKPALPSSYYKTVPQYCTFETPPFFHISIADKESGWRDFILENAG